MLRRVGVGVALCMLAALVALLALQETSSRRGTSALESPTVEYVPSSKAGKPKTAAALAGHWEYVPDAVLARAGNAAVQHPVAKKHKLVSLDDDEEEGGDGASAVPEDPSLAVNEADEAASVAEPFSGERSCGIESLVQQASAIFPRWDGCGYMMEDKPGSHGFISPPEDDVECTASMMTKPPCDKATVRKVKKGSLTGLRECLKGIKGLSQTCYYFDKCGPIASSGPFEGRRSSVCFAPEAS
jgi:hypothetical protein